MDAHKVYKAAILLALLITVVLLFVFLKSKRKELGLALGTVIFSLLVGEIVLRLFFPQISELNQLFAYDAELGWLFIPHRSARIVYRGDVDQRVTINGDGFRDAERDLARKRSKRIMVLGDSFVSNVEVGADQVFTRVMEQRLADTEVLNFGVNGYGQVQEYLLLQRWFDRVRPDVVVVVIYLRNDFQDNVDEKWTYARPFASLEGVDAALVIHPAPADNPESHRGPGWRLYKRSHLYTLVNDSLDGVLRRAPQDDGRASEYLPEETVICRKDAPPSTRLMFDAMKKLVPKFRDLASPQGVPVVFVLAPSHIQVYDDVWLAATGAASQALYDRALPDRVLMQFAKDNGLLMTDLLPPLLAAGKTRKSLYFRYEQHWTREGNQLVAGLLVDYLRSVGLVK